MFDSLVGNVLWRRTWHPTPVFLPGECHGPTSLVGYSACGHKESDTTEWLTLSLFDYEPLEDKKHLLFVLIIFPSAPDNSATLFFTVYCNFLLKKVCLNYEHLTSFPLTLNLRLRTIRELYLEFYSYVIILEVILDCICVACNKCIILTPINSSDENNE